LSMLAHELRNPLAAISASLPLLARRDPLDDVEQRARDVLSRQAGNLGRLIDDLLDVARVTQGKIDVRWEVLDLSGLLRRVAENAQQTRTSQRNQRLEVELPAGPVYVRGDNTRLEQIFSNLLDNASKYTDPGGRIQIELATPRNGASDKAQVIVKDDGMGMSAQTLPSIFGLFSQADVPIARSRGGLGIGLTLVRTLVELHGGQVHAHSAGLGEGSEFAVVLPTLSEAELRSRVQHSDGAPLVGGKHKRRVLLIEDNIDAQQMLSDLLEIWGHEVTCASDGLAGVATALSLRPDIAIVDLGLPGIDGYEVARRIRLDVHGAVLPLIALTGYGSPEQKARSLAAGFDLHLVKPVDAARLESLLAQPALIARPSTTLIEEQHG
ncbi:MAG: ATP-binding protein, partial [Polyangiaceae bacterium]